MCQIVYLFSLLFSEERSRRKIESAKQTADNERKPLHNTSDDDDDRPVLAGTSDSESSESDDTDDASDILDEVIGDQVNDDICDDNVAPEKLQKKDEGMNIICCT